ncbi:MAG: aldo/keto reductase [Candidatus Aminicenantes bacterium]|nr:aldo/keto reductase [Candidatus Aminicenantes bacterium]
MLYRMLGRTGCEVSNLGFGCMRLPLKSAGAGAEHPRLADVDEDRSIELIRSAVDQGVNYFDTAYSYHGGKSEAVLGRAVRGMREKVLLTTKLPVWLVKTAESFDQLLDEQLQRLGTSYLDFYLLHALNSDVWPRMIELGVFKFLDRIVADGRVRRVGFSFHDDAATFKKIVDAYGWDICLIHLNYLDRSYQAGQEGLKYAAAKGLGVVIMEPLRGGTLTNPIPAEVEAVWNAAPKKRSPAEWALTWLWDQPEVGTVISGMNSAAQLRENIEIAGRVTPRSLAAEEFAVIDKAAETYRGLFKIGCTNCGYCLPCPQGVDIPMNFKLYNDILLFHNVATSRMLYNGFMPSAERASSCIECGECEKLCPQQIPIMAELKNVDAALAVGEKPEPPR